MPFELGRIEACGKLPARLLTGCTGIGERYVGPLPQVEGLLAPVKAVAEAPQLVAVGLDGDEQAVAVGEVIGLRRGLGVGDGTPQVIPVYGRVPAGSVTGDGNYTDTVIAAIMF